MYEHFRNEMQLRLMSDFDEKSIKRIIKALDVVSSNFDITEKCTELAIYNGLIPHLVDVYLKSMYLQGLSKNTLKLYQGRLKTFFEYVQKTPETITANDIRGFLITYQAQSGISDRTLDKVRQIINGFYVWLVSEEYLEKNPCHNIKKIKYEVEPRHALTEMQLEVLRRSCRNERELAMIDTLYSTGCRVTELVNMKFSDINRENRTIHIVGKGRKHNNVPINSNAELSINAYMASRDDDSDYIFVSKRSHKPVTIRTVEQMFSELSKISGVTATPHIIRHTSATHWLRRGLPLQHVQHLLGHASSSTTEIYAEVSTEDILYSQRLIAM